MNISLGERFARLSLAIDRHLPGYVDSFFGTIDKWSCAITFDVGSAKACENVCLMKRWSKRRV